MAIEVTENWTGKSSDDNGAVIVFTVTGVTTTEGAKNAVDQTGRGTRIPAHNSQYRERQEWKCSNRSATSIGPVTWIVTCTFAEPVNGSRHPDEMDPLAEPPDLISRTGTVSDVLDRDFFGNPLLNSARDPFTGLTDERNVEFLTIIKNLPKLDRKRKAKFERTTNSTDWTLPDAEVIPAGHALCLSIEASAYKPGARYVQVAHNFLIDPLGHKLRVLDEGYNAYYFEESDSKLKKVPVYGPDGTPYGRKVLLNSKGGLMDTALRLGASLVEPGGSALNVPAVKGATFTPTGDAWFAEYVIKGATNFSELGLG